MQLSLVFRYAVFIKQTCLRTVWCHNKKRKLHKLLPTVFCQWSDNVFVKFLMQIMAAAMAKKPLLYIARDDIFPNPKRTPNPKKEKKKNWKQKQNRGEGVTETKKVELFVQLTELHQIVSQQSVG